MTVLLFINILAAVFALLGFHLAFRQKALRRWLAKGRGPQHPAASEASTDSAGVDAVLRMSGVMLMAFSITGSVFANLIAYYAAHSPN